MASDIAAGASIRVKEGITAPDLPDYSITGWTGTITQVSGKKGAKKIFVEWDESTLNAMSEDFKQACEEQQLYYLMACLKEDEIEIV